MSACGGSAASTAAGGAAPTHPQASDWDSLCAIKWAVLALEEAVVAAVNGRSAGIPPRPNFNTVTMGITQIFAVAIGDDWNLMMARSFRAEGYIAIIFYPMVFIVMNLILLNLFLAILLDSFVSEDDEQEVTEDQLAAEAEA